MREAPPPIDLARTRDPFILVTVTRAGLDAIRTTLRGETDGEWRDRLARDARLRELVMDELYVAAVNLARLTLLVESAASADPDLFLDLADHAEELHELRAIAAERRESRSRPDENTERSVPAPLSPVGTAPHEASAEGAQSR